jgi:hypothetical protein
MKKIIISLMLLTFCLGNTLTALAADKWTREDIALEFVFGGLLLCDYRQTKYIAEHPETYYEKNFLLGKHPSVGEVNTHFLSSLILHAGITHILPQEYRKYWQGIWIIKEADSISGNLGIKINIEF